MIEAHFEALRDAVGRTSTEANRLRAWGRQLATVLPGGARLLACGNGGSAAEAQHLTAELVGRFRSSSSGERNSSLVMPMPCSPEITPPRLCASRMMRATARVARCSMA